MPVNACKFGWNHLQKDAPYQNPVLTAMIMSTIMNDFFPPNMSIYFSGIDTEQSRLMLTRRCRRRME